MKPPGSPGAVMGSTAEDNAALRVRLAALLQARPPLDVVVSHIEVNDQHGVGVLLRRIFAGQESVLSIRSQDHFEGDQRFGMVSIRLSHAPPRPRIYAAVLAAVRDLALRRVLCVPYYPDDAWTAIALKDTHGLPLCTYLMDDQNVHAQGIPDDLMRELLAKSGLRLAISAEMCDAYQRKFGLPVGVLPPVVDSSLVSRRPQLPPAAALASRCGVVVGNVWSQRWLALLRATLRGAGLTADWYCNSGLRWTSTTQDQFAHDGLRVHGAVSDETLVTALRESPFALIPSGTLDENDDRRFLAELSLPSRITYVLATSHTPLLVLGDARTAAARFVTRAGIGLAVPYDPAALLRAVETVCAPDVQDRMRRRAAAMAPGFRADGVLDWIWRSLEAGAPVGHRYERLLLDEA